MPSGLVARLPKFRENEDGVTSIEYAVIIAVISGVLLVALPSLGDAIGNPMTSLTSALNGDGDGGGGGDGGDDDGGGDGEHD